MFYSYNLCYPIDSELKRAYALRKGLYMYEIQIGIGYNWEHLGADDDAPCYYTTRKEAEEELHDMWKEMDIQQMDYDMDDYVICEVHL